MIRLVGNIWIGSLNAIFLSDEEVIEGDIMSIGNLGRTTVVAICICLVWGIVGEAQANFRVNGSLRTEFSYAIYDAESSPDGGKLTSLEIFNITNSRLMFSYFTDDKRYKAYAEIGIKSRTAGNSLYIRQAYFSYKNGGFQLLMGQAWPLAGPNHARQLLDGYHAMYGYGEPYFARTEQIRFTLGTQFQISFALESTKKDSLVIYGPRVDTDGSLGYGNDPRYGLPIIDPVTGGTNLVSLSGNSYYRLPPMALGAKLDMGNVAVFPWVRWEWPHLRYSHPVSGERRKFNFHSVDIGLEIIGHFGYVGFSVGANYGRNSSLAVSNGATAQAGYTSGSMFYAMTQEDPALPVVDPFTGESVDHRQAAFHGELRLAGLAVGAGFQKAWRTGSLNGYPLWPQQPWSLGVYANYRFNCGRIVLIPEILWQNRGRDQANTMLGDVIRVGLFTMVNF